MKLIRVNKDKSHRCPSCHGITGKARASGKAKTWRLYKCEPYGAESCGVVWIAPNQLIYRIKWKLINQYANTL